MNNARHILSIVAFAVLVMWTASCTKASDRSGKPWIERYIADQAEGSRTVVELVEYQNKPAFHILPEDRHPDAGDEHQLFDQSGNLICEFGGYVGRVTKGACDIRKINYRKTLLPKRSNT